MSKFKVTNLFSIVNRGQVLAGHIIEGDVKSGDLIQYTSGGLLQEFKINSVEAINSKESEVGLMIDSPFVPLQEMIGQTISIIKS